MKEIREYCFGLEEEEEEEDMFESLEFMDVDDVLVNEDIE